MLELGFRVTKINAMARDLNHLTASSFTDKQEIYKLATDIMLEASEIRKIIEQDSQLQELLDSLK